MRQTVWNAVGIAALVLAGAAAWLLRDRAITQRWKELATLVESGDLNRGKLRVDLGTWQNPEDERRFTAELQIRFARNRKVDELGELAEFRLADGNLPRAEAALRGLLVFDRHAAKWPHLLGRLLADSGRLDEAVPFLQRATKLEPAALATWLKLGEALAKTNQPAPAANAFRAALAIEPNNPWARLGLARLEIADGRWTAARLLLEDTVRDTPDFSAAHSLLATAYERSGRNEEAERSRTRATALGRFAEPPDPWFDPLWKTCTDPYRLRVTAATYTATGRPAEALPVLERAREINPKDARTQRELGRLLLKLGRPADARVALDEATQLEPAEPAAYLDLLEAARLLRDDVAIDAVIARGLVYCPNSAGLHYAHAKRLIAADKPAEAEVAIANAIRLEPESPTGYETHAIVLFQLGRAPDAVRELEAGIARVPHAAPLWRLLFHYHQQRGDSVAAAKVMTRAQSAGIRPELLRE